MVSFPCAKIEPLYVVTGGQFLNGAEQLVLINDKSDVLKFLCNFIKIKAGLKDKHFIAHVDMET